MTAAPAPDNVLGRSYEIGGVVRVVTIGGRSQKTVLKALVGNPEIEDITAICGVTDTGGSTGKISEDYGALGHYGDATQCMVELCPDKRLRDRLMHRYPNGCLAGHSRKNLLLFDLEEAFHPDRDRGLREAHRILGIPRKYRVMPVTREKTTLKVGHFRGTETIGETNIDTLAETKGNQYHPHLDRIMRCSLAPLVYASKAVIEAIMKADWCIIGPGDLYTSILAVLLIGGIKEAFRASHANVVVVINLMTKQGETQDYGAEDFAERIQAAVGRPCQWFLVNNRPIPKESRTRYYAQEKKIALSDRWDRSTRGLDTRVVKAPLLSVMPDGRVCHDPKALAKTFKQLFKKKQVVRFS